MAISVRSVSFRLGNNSSSNNGTLSFTPDASWAAGDVAMAYAAWSNSTTFTRPTGWTQVGTTLVNSSSSSMAKCYKVLTSADLSTSFTFTIATSTRFVVVVFALTGVDNTNPIDSSSQANGTAGTSWSCPSDTTVAPNTFLTSAWAARWSSQSGLQTISVPGGSHTSINQSGTNNGTVQESVAVGYLTSPPTSAGSYGPYACSTTNASTLPHGMQMAFLPESTRNYWGKLM